MPRGLRRPPSFCTRGERIRCARELCFLWTICFKKFSHASQFSMRPMKKMRLQPASPRPKMLPLLKSGAGAISRDVTRRRCFLDYVQPTDLLSDATKAASRKASLSVRDLLIRSFLAGGLLAYATSLVFIVLSQNVAPIVGALLFPVGFVILEIGRASCRERV